MKDFKIIILVVGLLLFAIGCKRATTNGNSSGSDKQDLVEHHRPEKNRDIERIAFSSGNRPNLGQEHWKVIKDKNPDLWIWLGDLVYSNSDDLKKHKKNFDALKNDPNYQDFIRDVAVLGVWDDHDYGMSDGNKTNKHKDESKDIFLDFLDVDKDAAVRKHKGLYDSWVIGTGRKKIKFYFLDNRYFKDELQKDEATKRRYLPNNDGTVLGEEQWTWLEDEIKNSDASVNIFLSGLQIIPDEHPYEKWGDFPKERKRFLDLLEKYKVKNPLILSGDRHFAELSEYTYIDFSDKVLELTASGLTHSYKGVVERNSYRLGDLYDGKNFGFIEIYWGGSKIMMKLFIYDINGKKIIEHGVIADY